jgi:hypothetical protein
MLEIRELELSASVKAPELSIGLSNAPLHMHYGVFTK